MKLISDFHDYYDSAFDGEGGVFVRNRWAKPPKPSLLRTLSDVAPSLGLSVIPYGRVSEMPRIIRAFYGREEGLNDFLVVSSRLVVYTQGAKLLVPMGVAMELYPEEFSTLYLFTWPYSGSSSFRWIQIGRVSVVLKYVSYTSWNSREGEVDVVVKRVWRGEASMKLFGSPIFAIDFITSSRGLFALDMEVNPVLQGTGVEDYLSPDEVRREVELAMSYGDLCMLSPPQTVHSLIS